MSENKQFQVLKISKNYLWILSQKVIERYDSPKWKSEIQDEKDNEIQGTGNPKDDGKGQLYDSCVPDLLKKEQVKIAAFRKLKKKCLQRENKQIYRDGKWISGCLELGDSR